MKIRCILFSPADSSWFDREVLRLVLNSYLISRIFTSVHYKVTRFGHPVLNLPEMCEGGGNRRERWQLLKSLKVRLGQLLPAHCVQLHQGEAWNTRPNSKSRTSQKKRTGPRCRGMFLDFHSNHCPGAAREAGRWQFLPPEVVCGEGRWLRVGESTSVVWSSWLLPFHQFPPSKCSLFYFCLPLHCLGGMLPRRSAFQLKEQVRQSCCLHEKRCLLGCVGGTFFPLLSFPLKTNTKPAVSSAEGDGSQLHLN